MSKLTTGPRKTGWQQLVFAAVFLLVPGVSMLLFPDFFASGLWNSINLIRVAGGIFLAFFAAMVIFRFITTFKDQS